MNLTRQRWVSSLQCRNQCIRFLSEKSRNRKWELPNPIKHSNALHKNPSSSTSTPAKPPQKQPAKYEGLEFNKTRGNTTHPSAVRKSSLKGTPSHRRIQPTKIGCSTPPSAPSSQASAQEGTPKVSKAGLEPWLARKLALKEKFSEGWRPGRRISPEAMEGIRILKKQVSLSFGLRLTFKETTFHCYGAC
jgi:hypothetical protein